MPLPGAREALERLGKARVPYIFLTNGGGELEEVKAAKLSKILDLCIHPSQVVLSHTPMRPLCKALGEEDARVLVLGCREVVAVARSYGLTKIDTAQALLHDTPSLYPFIDVPRQQPLPHRGEPFKAVLVLHDPNSWGLELQVTLDVLRGGEPLGSGKTQSVPYYASNADLTFAGAYPAVPRLAGGAFTTALHALWQATHPQGGDLVTQFFGKPSAATYTYAEAALGAWAEAADASGWHGRALQGPGAASAEEVLAVAGLAAAAHAAAPPAPVGSFAKIVMVGDNPLADIRGGNQAASRGRPWESALVATGVWKSGEPLVEKELSPSLGSFAGVLEAVKGGCALFL